MDFADILNASKANEVPLKGTKKQQEKQRLFNEGKKSLGVNGLAAKAFAANPILGYTYEPNKDYRENGIVQTHLDNAYDLNKRLADKQGILTQTRNSLIRTVADTVLDTAAGFSDLATMPYDIYQRIFTENPDRDFNNPVTQLLNSWKENVDENFKIYTQPDASFRNGGLFQASWLLDNVPSLFSSLSMLIPSKAATVGVAKLFKGISKLSKTAKTSKLAKAKNADEALNLVGDTRRAETAAEISGRQTSRAQQIAMAKDAGNATEKGLFEKTSAFYRRNKDNLIGAADVVANATLSRMMENYQESRGVYNQTFEMSLDYLNQLRETDPQKYEEYKKNHGYENMSDSDIAKKIAGDSADEDFKDNLWNLGFDIMQFYGLRNMWKGNANLLNKSNFVKDIQKKELEKLATNVTRAEVTDAINKTSLFTQALKPITKTGNVLWRNKGFIANEGLGEGAEEIINYISEQEGIHIGKKMLELDDGKSNFKYQRLKSYFDDDGLWDSAFWGFAGGLLFGSVGDRVMNYAQHRSWHSAQENAQKRVIESRYDKVMEGFKRLNELNKGYKFDKNGNPIVSPMSEEQLELEKNKVMRDTVREIALAEAKTGTGDYLQDWIKDDNLRKLFVEKGFVTEEESKEFTSQLLKETGKIQDLYDKELQNLTKMAKNINGSINGNILPQYVDLIATSNVRNRLEKEQLQSGLDAIQTELDNKATDTNEDYISHLSIIEALDASAKISELETRKSEIEKNKKLGDEIDIRAIDDEIEQIKQDFNLSTANTPTTNAFMQLTSKLWEINIKDGKTIKEINPDSMEKLSADEFRSIDSNITDEQHADFIKTVSNYSQFRKKKDNPSDPNSGNEVDSLLRSKSSLKGGISKLDAYYIDTHLKLVNSAEEYDGLFSDVFQDILIDAGKAMAKYAVKYNTSDKPRHVQKVLQKYLDAINDSNFDKSTFDKEGISNEDFNAMLEHIDAVTIKSLAEDPNPNRKLAQNLGQMMSRMEVIERKRQLDKKAKKEAEKKEASHVNKNSSNQQQTTQQQQTSQTQQTSQSQIQQQPQQQGQASPTPTVAPTPTQAPAPTPTQVKLQRNNLMEEVDFKEEESTDTFSFSNNMNLVNDPDHETKAKKVEENMYILQADSMDYTTNSNLYKSVNGFSWEKEVVVNSHPVVEIKDGKVTVLKQGVLTNKKTAPIVSEQAPNPDTTETPIIEQVPDPDHEDDIAKRKQLAAEAEAILREKENNAAYSESKSEDLFSDLNMANGMIMSELSKEENLNRIAAIGDPVKQKEEIDKIWSRVIDTFSNHNQDASVVRASTQQLVNRIKNYIELNKLQTGVASQSRLFKDAIIKVRSGNPQYSAIISVQNAINYYTITDPENIFNQTEEAIENLLEEYGRLTDSIKINGVRYINIEQLFSGLSEEQAKLFYPFIKHYIDNSTKFVATDDSLSREDIIYSTMSQVKVQTTNESIRIDIFDYVETLSENEQKEFWNEFNKLEKGEVLTLEKKGEHIEVKSSRGKIIGRLRIPKVNPDGSYHMVNDGIIWNLSKEGSNYKGRVVNFLNDLFDNTIKNDIHDGIEQLRENIFELAFSKTLTPARRKELENAIATSQYIEDAKNIGLLANYMDNAGNNYNDMPAVVNGFIKLAKYITNPKNTITTTNDIKATLNNFYEKKYQNWVETDNISNGSNRLTYKISNITEGKYVRNDGKMVPVSQSVVDLISDTKSPGAHRIAVMQGGNMHVAGIPMDQNPNPKFKIDGQTALVMPVRGQSVNYVAARPVVLSKSNSKFQKEIFNPIVKHIINLTKQLNDSNVDSAFNDLKNFISKNFGVKPDSNGHKLFLPTQGIQLYINDDTITLKDLNTETVLYINKYAVIAEEGEAQPDAALGYNYVLTDSEGNKSNKSSQVRYGSTQAERLLTEFFGKFQIFLNSNNIDGDFSSNAYKDGEGSIVSRNRKGEFILAIPGENGETNYYTYSSFNAFVLDNDLLNVDLGKVDGSNYIRSNPNDMVRATIEIQTSENFTKDLNERDKAIQFQNYIDELEDKIEKICKSDSNNKGVEIVAAIIEHSKIYNESIEEDLKPLLDLIKNNADDFVILPKIIKFVKDKRYKLNKDIEHDGAYASNSVNPDTNEHEVSIGTNFISLMDIRGHAAGGAIHYDPKFAITTLIHEQLHTVFKEDKYGKQDGIIDSMKENVYLEFVNSIKRLSDKNRQRLFAAYIPGYEAGFNNLNDDEFDAKLDEIIEEQVNVTHRDLEEFIVRSLTDATLMTYLNTTTAVNKDNRNTGTDKTIFQKLIDAILKLFNVNVNKGTILYNEYLALGKAIDSTAMATLANRIQNDSDNYNLTENEESYTDGVQEFARPTTVLKAAKDNTKSTDSKAKELEDKYTVVSTNIGTGIDEFVRDYFLYKDDEHISKLTDEQLEERYPNAKGSDFRRLIEQLDNFQKELTSKGITILSRDVKAVGNLSLYAEDGTTILDDTLRCCGTLDLLGYDNQGNWYIYDMKTMTRDKSQYSSTVAKWTLQLNLYRDFLEKKYSIAVKEMNIIPIQVSYDANQTYTVDGTITDKNNPNRVQLKENNEIYRGALSREDDGLMQTYNAVNKTTSTNLVPIGRNDIKIRKQDLESLYGTNLLKYLNVKIEAPANTDEGIMALEDLAELGDFGDIDIELEENSNIIATDDNYSIDVMNFEYQTKEEFLSTFEPSISRKLRHLIDSGELSIACR